MPSATYHASAGFLLAVVLAASLCGVATAAEGDAPFVYQGDGLVPDSGDAQAGDPAVANHTQVTQGEQARIAVSTGSGSAVTLTVGGPTYNYVVAATLRDGDGDGRVDVVFDSAAAGHDEPTLSAADEDDEVTARGDETALEGWLEAADYPVSVSPDADADADPVDDGTLVVNEPDVGETASDGVTGPVGPPGRVGADSEGAGASIAASPEAAGAILVGVGLSLIALRLLFDAGRR